MTDARAGERAAATPDAIVYWRYPGGGVGHGSPLRREEALAMQKLYAARYTELQFWIGEVAPQEGRP